MAQRALSTRRVVRIVAAIGTILALMLAGGAPSDYVESVGFFQLGNR